MRRHYRRVFWSVPGSTRPRLVMDEKNKNNQDDIKRWSLIRLRSFWITTVLLNHCRAVIQIYLQSDLLGENWVASVPPACAPCIAASLYELLHQHQSRRKMEDSLCVLFPPIRQIQADGSGWNVSTELKMVSLGAIGLLTDKGWFCSLVTKPAWPMSSLSNNQADAGEENVKPNFSPASVPDVTAKHVDHTDLRSALVSLHAFPSDHLPITTP